MRILVTGSREWTDWRLLHRAVEDVTKGILGLEVTIVHGYCPTGADHFAGDYARCAGMTEEPHPADWARYGKKAGAIRNQEMADAGADVCLAFFEPGRPSKGTTDCVFRAKRAGIPIRLYPEAA